MTVKEERLAWFLSLKLNPTEKLVLYRASKISASPKHNRQQMTDELDAGRAHFHEYWKVLTPGQPRYLVVEGLQAHEWLAPGRVAVAIDSLQERGLLRRGSNNAASKSAGTDQCWFLTKEGASAVFHMGRIQGRYGWRPVRPSDRDPMAPSRLQEAKALDKLSDEEKLGADALSAGEVA